MCTCADICTYTSNIIYKYSQVLIGDTMKKARLLIVDDAKYIHDMIRDMLDGDRYEIVGNAENGEEAIVLYNKLNPDIVIMDMVMEGMDGLTATKKIIKYDPDAIILVISASSYSKHIKDVIEAGAKQHLWKPFMVNYLVKTVEKLLSNVEIKTVPGIARTN